MKVIARGYSVDGDSWELEVGGGPAELCTMVAVTLAGGQRLWGTGAAGPALHPGRRLNVATGSNDVGPRNFIARVRADVRAVVVTLSDGTREDLVLYGDADEWGARVGVLVYPRDLDIHRVDLYGHDGAVLGDSF